MNYNNIVAKVAEDLELPEEVVNRAYKSYWEFIKKTIKDLPLKEDISIEKFSELRTNFNIPSLGKLSCTYDRMASIKKKFNQSNTRIKE